MEFIYIVKVNQSTKANGTKGQLNFEAERAAVGNLALYPRAEMHNIWVWNSPLSLLRGSFCQQSWIAMKIC